MSLRSSLSSSIHRQLSGRSSRTHFQNAISLFQILAQESSLLLLTTKKEHSPTASGLVALLFLASHWDGHHAQTRDCSLFCRPVISSSIANCGRLRYLEMLLPSHQLFFGNFSPVVKTVPNQTQQGDSGGAYWDLRLGCWRAWRSTRNYASEALPRPSSISLTLVPCPMANKVTATCLPDWRLLWTFLWKTMSVRL